MSESALPDAIQLLTTTGSFEDARRLSELLVQRRYAACVQIDGPIESVYRWQGKIEQSQEWRLTAKTTAILAEATIEFVRRHHAYEEPELICLPIVAGSKGYLRWLATEVRAPKVAFLLYGPDASPFSISFEALLERLAKFDNMFVELDGSFVWRPEGSERGQIDGMVYDAGTRVQYLDLKGCALYGRWQLLFDALVERESATAWNAWTVVQLPGQTRYRLEQFRQEFLNFDE